MTATLLMHQMQNHLIFLRDRTCLILENNRRRSRISCTQLPTHQSVRSTIHRLSRQFISTDHPSNSVSLFTCQSVHCFLIRLPSHSKNEHINHVLKTLHWLLFSNGLISTWSLVFIEHYSLVNCNIFKIIPRSSDLWLFKQVIGIFSLVLPKARTVLGRRDFSVTKLRYWNSLNASVYVLLYVYVSFFLSVAPQVCLSLFFVCLSACLQTVG